MFFGSGVDRVLEFLARLELGRLAGRYLRGLARSGIPPLARRSICNGERSEADQVDLFPACQCRCDRGHRRVYGLGNSSIGLVGAGGNRGDQVGLVHAVLVGVIDGWN